jgi:hypothetical protein
MRMKSSLFERIIDKLCPEPKSDFEVVIDKIRKQDKVFNFTATEVDPHKDQFFAVGVSALKFGKLKYFYVRFDGEDTRCTVSMPNDSTPLYIFNNPEQVRGIRSVIVDKFNEGIVDKHIKSKDDFANM